MKRIGIDINGIVQGVGFRPFIHKMVNTLKIHGYVRNTITGVYIEAEGDNNVLKAFVDNIVEKKPRLSEIESIKITEFKELKYYSKFEIIHSSDIKENGFTLVSPDVCICDDCLAELFDKSDKRYKFPFINCTNCGPRFTIIKKLPYDRPLTVMNDFKLCNNCEFEYNEISNRRYHAQPTCCKDCGPVLWFEDYNGCKIETDAINEAQKYITEGRIIAIKGIGGFHLAAGIDQCDKLRQRKCREQKPFAIMCRDLETVKKWCYIDEYEKQLLESYRRPIVLLKKRNNDLDDVAPNNKYLGVMLPYSPIHYLLMDNAFDTLIMTSANISDTPIVYNNDEARLKLKGIADGFILTNRDIHVRCDDSVMRIIDKKEYPIRRSRGYAPFPVKVNKMLDQILACGAEQKASFCVSNKNYLFLSPHIGDLKNIETLTSYEIQLKHYLELFNINIKQVACDLHPDYLSTDFATNYAKNSNLVCKFVQHHHAHMASCMADNNLDGDVIGIIWDGTGLGLDNEVWGGEFLVGGYSGFRRMGSLRKIKLPGGDIATKEIYRIADGMINDVFSFIPEDVNHNQKRNNVREMIKNNVNIIETSSVGRLFDGVASILGLCEIVSYEGQAAIILENCASDSIEKYSYTVNMEYDKYIFDWHTMIVEIVDDIKRSIDIPLICSKFMNTLCFMCKDMMCKIRNDTGLNRVVLSGGVFQNIYLLKRITSMLAQTGFEVYVHSKISCNDEGISLGQLMIVQEGGEIKCV